MNNKKIFSLFILLSHLLFAAEEPTHFKLSPLPCSIALISAESAKKGAELILALDEIPGMHALNDKTVAKGYKTLDEVFNFRYSKDHTRAGFAQPSKAGIERVLDFMGSSKSDGKATLYFDLREEPVIFINGKSYGFRQLDKQTKNLFLTGLKTDQLNELEKSMKQQVLQAAKENGGKIRIRREVTSSEGSSKILIDEIMVSDKNVRTTDEIFTEIKGDGYLATFFRVPITDEHAPTISDVNEIVNAIDKNTQVPNRTFHCHFGHGRTTTGLTISSIYDFSKSGHFSKDLSEEALAIRALPEVQTMTKLLKFTEEDFAILDAATNENAVSMDVRHDVLAKLKKGSPEQIRSTMKRYLMLMSLTTYMKSAERKAGLDFSKWLRSKPELAKFLIK